MGVKWSDLIDLNQTIQQSLPMGKVRDFGSASYRHALMLFGVRYQVKFFGRWYDVRRSRPAKITQRLGLETRRLTYDGNKWVED